VGLTYSQFTDVVTLIRAQNNLLNVPVRVLVVDKPKRIPVFLGCCARSVGNRFPVFQENTISTTNSSISRQLGGPKNPKSITLFQDNLVVSKYPIPFPTFQDNTVVS